LSHAPASNRGLTPLFTPTPRAAVREAHHGRLAAAAGRSAHLDRQGVAVRDPARPGRKVAAAGRRTPHGRKVAAVGRRARPGRIAPESPQHGGNRHSADCVAVPHCYLYGRNSRRRTDPMATGRSTPHLAPAAILQWSGTAALSPLTRRGPCVGGRAGSRTTSFLRRLDPHRFRIAGRSREGGSTPSRPSPICASTAMNGGCSKHANKNRRAAKIFCNYARGAARG